MFVGCILVSYPLQFYVPMERIEKWISRKIPEQKQNFLVYFCRYSLVILTCKKGGLAVAKLAFQV